VPDFSNVELGAHETPEAANVAHQHH